MYLIKSPGLFNKFTSDRIIWEMPSGEKKIYLTFDDGPVSEITPEVIKILNEYDAKATFFCVGENVFKNPGIYNTILDNNHAVGIHTYNHLNGWKITKNEYSENILKCENLISSNLFRPPYGKIKPLQINEIKKKYFIIFWTVLSGDFDKTISNEQCLKNVISYAKDGSIIVFHDSLKAKERMIYALKGTLDFFKSKGYSFEKIEVINLNIK